MDTFHWSIYQEQIKPVKFLDTIQRYTGPIHKGVRHISSSSPAVFLSNKQTVCGYPSLSTTEYIADLLRLRRRGASVTCVSTMSLLSRKLGNQFSNIFSCTMSSYPDQTCHSCLQQQHLQQQQNIVNNNINLNQTFSTDITSLSHHIDLPKVKSKHLLLKHKEVVELDLETVKIYIFFLIF